MTDDKFHYINKAGKDFGLIDSIGNDTKSFRDGYAIASNTSYPYVLIDQNGKPIKQLMTAMHSIPFQRILQAINLKNKPLWFY